MKRKNKKKSTKSIVSTTITLFAIFLVLVNTLSFFSIDADQFNFFHKYSEVHRLETWNIPNNVDVDINKDGIKDRITWTGCIILGGSIDKDIIANQYECDTESPKRIRVFKISDFKPFQVRLSYIGKRVDNNWEIVLVKNLDTNVFKISKGDKVTKSSPEISLQLDTIIYFASHLFVLMTGM